MELKQIQLNDQMISYILIVKNVKYCKIKIVQGQLQVIVHRYISIHEIEKMIQQHKQEILQLLSSYKAKYSYQDNGYIYLFNQRLKIVLDDQNKYDVKIQGDQLFVYHQDIEYCVEVFLGQQLKQYCQVAFPRILKDFDLTMPQVSIKRYQSKWGSCQPNKNMVRLNLALAHLDYDLIDYVIIHELCHFYELNHSHRFYEQVKLRCPNYKVLQKRLKGEQI